MSGLGIDTRSDVYSLGVLLYELLTGRTPFDSETLFSKGLEEMRRIIREQEPPRPSLRISTLKAADVSTVSTLRSLEERRLQHELTGELDWIVMKALEKERNRRYESASAFAADLQRYLANEPVLACPPSVSYRLSKLIQRNRLAFAGSSFALLVMVVAIVGLSVTNSILSDAKQRTDDALDQARQNEQIAETRTRESVAAAAARASEQQAQEERQLAEQHYRRSLELVQSLVASISEWKLSEQPGMERYRLQLLESARDALAALHHPERVDRQLVELQIQVLTALGTDYRSMQKHQEAANAFRAATEVADELASLLKSDGDAHRMLRAYPRYPLMFALKSLGQPKDAIREIGIAIQLAEDELKENEEDHVLRGALCNMLSGLSDLEYEVGNTAASHAALHREGLLLGFTLSSDIQFQEPPTQTQLAALLSEKLSHDTVRIYFLNLAPRQKNPGIQAALFDQALTIGRQQLQSDNSRNRRFQHTMDLQAAAGMLSRPESRDFEQAVKYLQEAIPLLESLVTDFPTMTRYGSALVSSYSGLLSNLVALERFEEVAAIADSLAKRYPDQPLINEQLGTYYAERGEHAQQALKYYDRMIASAGEHATAHHYLLRGKLLAEQMQEKTRALEDFDRAFVLDPRPGVYWFGRRAAALDALGRREEAIAFLHGVSPKSASEFVDRAEVCLALGDIQQAAADFDAALTAPEAGVSVFYRAALFALTRDDRSQYRDICRRMLEKFGKSTTSDDNSFTAWTCSLAPQAIDDYAAAVKLAEQAVASTSPAQRWDLGALGAILLRSGNAERAVQVLADAAQQPATEKTSAAYVVYFEALALKQLGRSEEAAAKLKDANALTDQELSQTDAPPTWNRKQTLELLRKETEAVFPVR